MSVSMDYGKLTVAGANKMDRPNLAGKWWPMASPNPFSQYWGPVGGGLLLVPNLDFSFTHFPMEFHDPDWWKAKFPEMKYAQWDYQRKQWAICDVAYVWQAVIEGSDQLRGARLVRVNLSRAWENDDWKESLFDRQWAIVGGCKMDVDYDGYCPVHPQGCPPAHRINGASTSNKASW